MRASTPSLPSSLNGDLVSSGVALLAIIGGTVILFSERELASRWGAKFLYAENGSDPIEKRHALVDRCDAISKEKAYRRASKKFCCCSHQHKTISDIENELIVANGTVKAHIRHIYQKLDIHSREELFEILGTQACEEKQTANDEDCF